MEIPKLGDAVPTRGNRLSRFIGSFILKTFGWTIEGKIPNQSKFVAIAAPHTSNWDFVFGISFILAVGLRITWIGKHTIFKWPLGALWRWLGGMPIDRQKQHNLVARLIETFNQTNKLVIGVAPEGTRKRVEKWKTGFYHIADGAKVPILLGFFDYRRKTLGFGSVIKPSGNIESDMQAISEFYSRISPKHPEKFVVSAVHSKPK